MDKFKELLASSHLQIGFKKNLGCAPGLFLMQNTVHYFTSKNTPVYIATVDASKAFDRVDHKVLFQKLVNRGHRVVLLGFCEVGMVNLCHLSGGMVF